MRVMAVTESVVPAVMGIMAVTGLAVTDAPGVTAVTDGRDDYSDTPRDGRFAALWR